MTQGPSNSFMVRIAVGVLLVSTLFYRTSATVAVAGEPPLRLTNPVLPGDHPDPSIIRVGKTYWTASTAGNWAPEFSLYRSDNLRQWVAAGAVFQQTPTWADRDFWAPELVADGGRVLVYYVARKIGGGLCVAVATAASPAGPYEDHGPILCQEDGSIDPAFARDEKGKPYLIWKEDGNSQGKLTPIFAQPLSDDLIKVTGERKELIVNEPGSWEGGVVEAPYIMQHGGWFYMFYAGNACCGEGCKYAEGVARAKALLGPWEKDPANPIIRPNGAWKCPGHGSAVQTTQGKDAFLYHAYPASGLAYLGRESVMDAIEWSADGWPVVNGGFGPGGSASSNAAAAAVTDNFQGTTLSSEWKWPIGHEPQVQITGGKLTLTVSGKANQSFVARALLSSTYAAMVEVPENGGIGLIGGGADHAVLWRHGGKLELWLSEKGQRRTLWTGDALGHGPLWLGVTAEHPGTAEFRYRVGKGAWSAAGDRIDLKAMLPWDSGIRVGLVAEGKPGEAAEFRRFSVSSRRP